MVQLDGAILGYTTPALAKHMATALRIWKTEGLHHVPLDLEIGFVPTSRAVSTQVCTSSRTAQG